MDTLQELVTDVRQTKDGLARLELRFERNAQKTAADIGQVQQTLLQHEERFDEIDRRFDAVDKRFEQIDKRFEAIDRRFEAIDKRFDQIDARFEKVDQRFDKLEEQFGEFATELRGMNATLISAVNLAFEKFRSTAVDERLVRLEHAVFGPKT